MDRARPDRLENDVRALCGTTNPRNHRNLESLNVEAAGYVTGAWRSLGLSITEQRVPAAGREYKNLLVSFGPSNAARIIVGAHYDVCGEQPGADDNASGTAGLLELARLLHERKPDLKYRVDLVAYTLEEPPYFRTEAMGSAVHARSLQDAGVSVKVMICLEMIGYFTSESGSQTYPLDFLEAIYPDTGDFIAVVGKMGQEDTTLRIESAMTVGGELDVRRINAPRLLPGIDFSDHLNYWNHGYEAVMITDTAFFRNKQYHRSGDTPERLNYELMAEVVNGVYSAIVTME